MVYITGDTHGELKVFINSFIKKKLKKEDTLIICGDFGFIWNGDEREQRVLNKIKNLNFNILFLDGRHENFKLLEKYEKTVWNWGKVHKIAENLYHAIRGEIYIIESKTYFTFGGGVSDDLEPYDEYSQWEHEVATPQEMDQAFEKLSAIGKKVDYIITHEPPGRLKKFLNKDFNINLNNVFLDKIFEEVKYKKWFFGSLHVNKKISEKHIAIFNNIIPVENIN